MAMKETERSLRAYFLIAGIFGALWALHEVSVIWKIPMDQFPASWRTIVWFPAATHLPICIGFTVAGFKLKSALLGDPSWILRLLGVSGFLLVLQIALNAATFGTSFAAQRGAGTIVGIAITTYLYFNVKRLAREAKERAGQVALTPAVALDARRER